MSVRGRSGPGWLAPLALLVILVAATILVTWNVAREGTSNLYYAAAVRSMLQDPVALLFAGFDSGRYITLDKPPLGYQLQALSTAVLGFGGIALLLPQLVATVVSIGLVYRLVRPVWGAVAGVAAAAVLALTPITVAVARNTTTDATLVMALLLGALALQRGLRTTRARWLAVALTLVGVGFELKMLQAYLVLPAFAGAWLAAARGSLARRIVQLLAAALPLVVVSFAWPVVVQLWSPDYRPWIGGSTTNSLFDLAFGYNGVARLATGPAFGDTGTPGLLRFLEPVLAGQVAWLLPIAGLGVALGAWTVARGATQEVTDRDAEQGAGPSVADATTRVRLGSLVLWVVWLATCLAFFSVARFWHRHYLVVMAPAVAALAGIGLSLGWRALQRPGAAGWLLPAAVLACGLLAAVTMAHAADLGWLAEPVLAASLAVSIALGLTRGAWRVGWAFGRPPSTPGRLAAMLAATAIVVTLAPPAAWSAWTVAGDEPLDTALPVGGPPIRGIRPGLIDGGDGGRVFDPRPNAALVDFLVRNRGTATWILAVEGGLEAAPMIVQTGLPIMAIGGFQGRDPAIALDGFRYLVREGRLRFATAGEKASDLAGDPPAASTAADVVLDWVVETCAPVPGFETLYDCQGRG